MRDIGKVSVHLVQTATSGDIVQLRTTADGRPICPVCGCIWPSGAEHAWSGIGEKSHAGLDIVGPSWDTCPCCETEFGNDDVPDEGETVEQSWASLRRRWLERVGEKSEALSQVRENLGLGD